MRVVAGSEDRYDLDGTVATEILDKVACSKVTQSGVTFECVNEKTGFRLTKEYRAIGRILTKRVTYRRDAREKALLRVSSVTMIEASLYRERYYYVATDDGYKVSALPFLAVTAVKEPIPWTVSTGTFVYYFPKHDRAFAHYRYRVNGHYSYGDADRALESRFVPGGAVTAFRTAGRFGTTLAPIQATVSPCSSRSAKRTSGGSRHTRHG